MCIFCETGKLDGEAQPHLTDDEVLRAASCPELKAGAVPVSIITGFLGAGKTTFLNWLLREAGTPRADESDAVAAAGRHRRRYCVVQNEFGSISIDDLLVTQTEQLAGAAIITLPNGCACCTVRGDLLDGLKALARKAHESPESATFDAVLLETSCLSEVAPVAQTFFADSFVQRNFRLDAIIAVVDAANAPLLLKADADSLARAVGDERGSRNIDNSRTRESSESSEISSLSSGEESESDDGATGPGQLLVSAASLLCEQVSLADVILLNKMDTVSAEEGVACAHMLSEMNPVATVLPCAHGQVDMGQVLEIGSFSLQRTMDKMPQFLHSIHQTEEVHQNHRAGLGHDRQHGGHVHSQFGSVGLLRVERL